jgi:AraC-like DNA-binding protein
MSRTLHSEPSESHYREFAVPFPLRTHLLCTWTQFIEGTHKSYAHRVLPDGCIDIVFIDNAPPVVVGPWIGAFTALFTPGTKIVGTRFRPGCAPSVLGLPASALLNQSVALSDISRSLNEQFDGVADRMSLSARRAALEEALLSRPACYCSTDRAMSAAIAWLAQQSHGRVAQLSHWLGISSRHLQRRFVASVGYGPKTFQSVVRFQRLLHSSVSGGSQRTLADLAAGTGYADQAHMTRDVHRFSGTPPTGLLGFAECTLGWLFKHEVRQQSKLLEKTS